MVAGVGVTTSPVHRKAMRTARQSLASKAEGVRATSLAIHGVDKALPMDFAMCYRIDHVDFHYFVKV
jgi:hypothetical protein